MVELHGPFLSPVYGLTPQRPPMLRTGLLPLNRRASAPGTLEMLESHTPQSYRSGGAGHSAGYSGGHSGGYSGENPEFEPEGQLDAPPAAQQQRSTTVVSSLPAPAAIQNADAQQLMWMTSCMSSATLPPGIRRAASVVVRAGFAVTSANGTHACNGQHLLSAA